MVSSPTKQQPKPQEEKPADGTDAAAAMQVDKATADSKKKEAVEELVGVSPICVNRDPSDIHHTPPLCSPRKTNSSKPNWKCSSNA